MAAVQCNDFVGNAWKKDLCLNCFKSKEEHVMRNWISNPVITRIPDPPKEGILKGKKSNTSTPKENKVNFLNTEYEVIGFGGDDVYSEDEDCPNLSSDFQGEEDEEAETEEDRAFQKLTKTNTDYNSIPENLQEPKEGEVKKIIEPLKLGKQVFDDKGNKKTLLVSVTPFGDQTTIKNKINVNGFKMNGHKSDSESLPKSDLIKKDILPGKVKIIHEKTEIIANGGVKERLVDIKCLNSEVLEKNENFAESAQVNEDDKALKLMNDKILKRSQPLDKNLKFKLNKNPEISENEESDLKNDKLNVSDTVNGFVEKPKKKFDQLSVISDSQSFKLRTKEIPNPFVKKSENDQAVILDIYKIQECEDFKTKNGIGEENTVRNGIISPNKFFSSEIKISTSAKHAPSEKVEKLSNGFETEQNKLKSFVKETVKNNPESVQNGLNINHGKLVPNVSSLHRHHFKTAKKSGENGVEEPLRNDFHNSVFGIPNTESENLRNNGKPTFECTEDGNNVVGNLTEEKEAEAEKSDDKFKKTAFESFENFERIIQGEEITLFSAERKRESTDKKEEKNRLMPEISRESAGEPDGRADSDDLSEPPALPLKPPPLLTESRSSFLHDLTAGSDGIKISEKPKVPAKPLIIQSKKINFQSPVHPVRAKSPSIEKFLDLTSSPTIKSHLPLQESLSSDSSKNQKRPAPKPPSPKEDSPDGYVAILADVDSNDAVLKQLEQELTLRDPVKGISRSTENLLELITVQEQKEQLSTEGLEEISIPEPMPRRSLSLSQDSLVLGEVVDSQLKKKPSRGKFLLRKLLHLGKAKETAKDLVVRQKNSLPPTSKPKLEIIHPNDLNGSRVEVVPPARSSKSRRNSSSASSSSGEQRESDVLSDSSTSHSMSSSGNDSQNTIDQTKKPPPPPRGNSLDSWSAKPARPPPPKSIDILRQSHSSWNTSVEGKLDNLYVNLGEVRSGLVPNKPVRTGSLREVNAENSKRLMMVTSQPEDSDYESFVVAPMQYSTPSHQSDDNMYECVQAPAHRSSLPECDSSFTDSPSSNYTKEKRSTTNNRSISYRRSDGNVEVNSDYFKIKFMRSVSLPYCSSETESEIYSPYSFYGSELGEDDYESSTSSHILRMSRLKLKKGRSIVHKNLEDNYGAVIVANHEALAQVVEQMRQGPSPPPALRALSTAVNLRWTDFTITKDVAGVVVEKRVFYPALWGNHPVTLSLMAEQGLNSSFHAKGPFNLNPLTELNDLIPASFLPMLKKDGSELIQASISVLTRLQIETIETYGKHMSAGVLNDESKKEVNFVLLQIINAFKTLQAQGIEEAPKNLTNLVVCREERDPHPRICITHSFERSEEETFKASLCQCVTHAIKEILPPTDLTTLISNVLLKEKAVSLSQAKSILEFNLWGPADIAFGNSSRERESALQRWLDLERATILHGLVRTRAELTVFEEWQLLFLVRTNAKMMAEASWLLEFGVSEEISIA